MNVTTNPVVSRLALALAGFCLTVAAGMAGTIADFSAVGEATPKLELPDLSGHRTVLEASRDQLVMVHFFATWCEPCRQELPALQRLASSNSRSVKLVVISVAEPGDRVRRFTEQLRVTFPVLLDEDRSVSKSWKVSILPTTFVLDGVLKKRIVAETDIAWDTIRIEDIGKILERTSAGTQLN